MNVSSKSKGSGSSSNPQRKSRDVNAIIGSNVKFRRVAAGFTQIGLADDLSLAAQQIRKYEAGLTRIGAARLYEISRVLGVPVCVFYEGLEGVSASTEDLEALAIVSAPLGMDLLRSFSRMDAEMRRTFVSLAQQIVRERADGGADEEQ